MKLHQVIRVLRENKQWTLKDMADKIPMSVTGYTKIENGQTTIISQKLIKISEVLGVSVADLLNMSDKNIIYLVNENSYNSSNYYGDNNALILENEKLKLALLHKDELLKEKDKQIARLEQLLENLQIKSQTTLQKPQKLL